MIVDSPHLITFKKLLDKNIKLFEDLKKKLNIIINKQNNFLHYQVPN